MLVSADTLTVLVDFKRFYPTIIHHFEAMFS